MTLARDLRGRRDRVAPSRCHRLSRQSSSHWQRAARLPTEYNRQTIVIHDDCHNAVVQALHTYAGALYSGGAAFDDSLILDESRPTFETLVARASKPVGNGRVRWQMPELGRKMSPDKKVRSQVQEHQP